MPETPSLLERLLAGLLGASCLALVGARWLLAPVDPKLWGDRDLVRAAASWAHLPTAGAELNYGTGGRIPGGSQYVWIKLARLVEDSPEAAMRGLLTLDLVALLVVAWLAWRLSGPLAAAFAMATYVAAPVHEVAVGQLWNPGYLAPFVALSGLGLERAITTRRGGWLVLWALAAALACQQHLSALLWVVASGLTVLLWRPARPGLWLPAAAVAALVPYLPHLVDEARTGWPNTRMLGAQPYVSLPDPDAADPARWADLVEMARVLAGTGAGSARAHLDLLSLLPLLGLVVALVGLNGDATSTRVRRALALGVALPVISLVLDPYGAVLPRYLIVVLVCASVLVGAGLGDLAVLARSRPTLGLVAVLLSLAAMTRLDPLADRLRSAESGGEQARFERALDAAVARTGWSPASLASRTVVVSVGPDGPSWRAAQGVDDWLRRRGELVAAATAPPCAVMWRGRLPEGASVDALAAATWALPPPLPAPRVMVVAEHDLGDPDDVSAWRLAVAQTDRGLCPTSLVNPYLDTDAESAIRRVWEDLDVGEIARLPLPHGVRVVGVTEADPLAEPWDRGRLALGVDLVRQGEVVTATLHAHQLRGDGHNAGWFRTAMVRGVVVEGVDAAGAPVVARAPGLIGHRGAPTPVVLAGDLGSVVGDLILRLELASDVDAGRPTLGTKDGPNGRETADPVRFTPASVSLGPVP